MTPPEPGETNGRPGWKDFYEKLDQLNRAIQDSDKQTKQVIADTERRILDKFDRLNENGSPTARQALAEACDAQEEIKELDERMDDFILKYNIWNGVNSTLVIIAGWLGFK